MHGRPFHRSPHPAPLRARRGLMRPRTANSITQRPVPLFASAAAGRAARARGRPHGLRTVHVSAPRRARAPFGPRGRAQNPRPRPPGARGPSAPSRPHGRGRASDPVQCPAHPRCPGHGSARASRRAAGFLSPLASRGARVHRPSPRGLAVLVVYRAGDPAAQARRGRPFPQEWSM